MRILVTGATGLVGNALVPHLRKKGHDVAPLRRSSPLPEELTWDPERGVMDERALEGVDGVVHLAGESVASGRWTEAKKKRIRDSRVDGTRFLSETLAKAARPP